MISRTKIYRACFLTILVVQISALAILYYSSLHYYWYFSTISSFFLAHILIKNQQYNYNIDNPATVYSTLGIANIVSIVRGILICLWAGFLLQPTTSWITSLMYTAIVVLDVVDGFVARKTKRCTVLGSNIDNEFDALGMFIAVWMVFYQQQVPLFYLLVGVLYYLYKIHLYIRRKQNLSIHNLPTSSYRRFIAGANMIFLLIALSPYLAKDLVYEVSYVFAIPFYITFFRDWLVVIHRFDVTNKKYINIAKANQKLFFKLVPCISLLTLFCLVYSVNNMLLYMFYVLLMISVLLYLMNTYLREASIVLVFACILILLCFQGIELYKQIEITLSILLVTAGSNIR